MDDKTQKKLFTPVQIGPMVLKHRIVMPATSRLRGHWPSALPSELMFEYYGQRASDGGLLIVEATAISAESRWYHTAPGLYNDEQVAAWKRITDTIHAKGGFIFTQLSHGGRATSSAITGEQPVGASVDPTFWVDKSIVVSTPDGFSLPSPHRALETKEIPLIVEQYRVAAENAKRAGFDGIEIQAGQGHLIEQFLQDRSNRRSDAYGGSVENRVRLLVEVLEAVTPVWRSNQVGVRISASSTFSHMGDSNPRALFRHVATRLNEFELAYLHVIEPRISGADTVAASDPPVAAEELGKIFRGHLIAAGGFTPESAEEALVKGVASLIAFGRHFTSNPDLPYRIEHGYPLTPYDRSTFYAFDAKGYTDFPKFESQASAMLSNR